MRRFLPVFAIFAFMAMGCGGARNDVAPSTQPSLSSLTERPVVGALGVPLGTVTEIRARVVAGRELRAKAYEGAYLLRVMEVDGRPLAPPPVMEFHVPRFVSVKLASDHFALHELKTGSATGRLDSARIGELEKDYVGKEMRLVVYEVGEYSGIPGNLPADVPVWADRGFGFRTSLVVLAERP